MGHNDWNSRWVGPILAVAVVAAAFSSLPSVAQHVSGSSGHISSGHMSSGHMTAMRPMGSSRSMGASMRGGQRTGAIRANPPGARHRAPNHVHDHRFPQRRVAYGVGYVGVPYYGYPSAFIDADDADMGNDVGDDIAQQAQPNAPNGPADGPEGPYAEGPPGPYSDQDYPPPPRAPYNPEGYPQQQQNGAAAQNTATQSDGLDHPAVTLVFNDGRPPLQVRSYVLTGSSVFVAEDGHQRVIPVADLNLPATIQQNREVGVDFELPGAAR